ncbi:flagellar hook-basal body complex protein FliE [Vallicoccus soli]|nr:flagellar hook-basal body complex protein FliE [Vallicoccus soli]
MPIGMPVAPVVPLDPATTAAPAAAAGDGGFGALLAQGLQQVQGLQARADEMSVQAATGDLQDVHDYTIAATQASLATELATTLRNKGVEAFNEIMRMPL